MYHEDNGGKSQNPAPSGNKKFKKIGCSLGIAAYMISIMWKYILSLLLLVVVGTGLWYGAKAILPPDVNVVKPQIGPAVSAVYATGTVEATVMVPIAARLSARLTHLNVDEGNNVEKGQVLAQLEDIDLQKTIVQLQAKRQLAQSNYDRAMALVKQGVQSRKAGDEALSNLQAAEADVARAEAEADYTKLIAPADGLIIKRDGEIGQLIAANTPVFWMSCCAPLRITSEVDEEDIPDIKIGQKVLIQADAFPDQVFNGTVDAITPKGDPVARSYRVRIKFAENQTVPFMIGMTAETNIILNETNDAMLIPSTAIKGGKVWVNKNGKAVATTVKTGAVDTDVTQILSGLTIDDQVINDPKIELREGQSIRAHLITFKAKP